MTIQKEHLEQFKQEKLQELQEVDNVFFQEEERKIEDKVQALKNELYNELYHEAAIRRASINGEIAAVDRLMVKLAEPEVKQM